MSDSKPAAVTEVPFAAVGSTAVISATKLIDALSAAMSSSWRLAAEVLGKNPHWFPASCLDVLEVEKEQVYDPSLTDSESTDFSIVICFGYASHFMSLLSIKSDFISILATLNPPFVHFNTFK